MLSVRYEGLREVLKALNETDKELIGRLRVAFAKVGDLIKVDARARLVRFGQAHNRGGSFAEVAAGYDTRVRTSGNTDTIVSVGQSHRTSPLQLRRRPNLGDIQMKKSLLPARTANFDRAVQLVEDEIGGLLHEQGF